MGLVHRDVIQQDLSNDCMEAIDFDRQAHQPKKLLPELKGKSVMPEGDSRRGTGGLGPFSRLVLRELLTGPTDEEGSNRYAIPMIPHP